MIDCHTHTAVSPDGYDCVSASYQKACSLGLKAIAVTEHCEANRPEGPEQYTTVHTNEEHYFHNRDIFKKSMLENTEVMKHTLSGTEFVNGIELGQATQNPEFANEVAADERLDFIIGSVHEPAGRDDYAFLDYKNEDITKILDDYFDEILSLCSWGKFDILGHLTYPLRYICGEAGISVNLKQFEEKILMIFSELAKKDKGLEINTSGLRQKYGKTLPDFEYVRLFRECGGKIISIGSDAHKTADIGSGIRDGCRLAKEAGFDKIFYFKKHIPHGIPL